MSKAFTSESEDDGDVGADLPLLPAGTRNYMTPEGAQTLKAEIQSLITEHQKLALETVVGKNRARTIDRRLNALNQRLQALEIVDSASHPADVIRFGAWVTVMDGSGLEETWRIVGFDEADSAKGWISWRSPVATFLLGSKVGQSKRFQNRTLTIRRIAYRGLSPTVSE